MNKLVGSARRRAIELLRSPWLADAAGAIRPRSLRILAYHGVGDAEGFDAQLEWLTRRYQPVDTNTVAAAARGKGTLPDRAVWVTFDDGDPTVISHGLELLVKHDVRATMFVCPGLIESGRPFWWRQIEAADLSTLSDLLGVPIGDANEALALVKVMSDPERRRVVDALPDPPTEDPFQIGTEQFERWLDAGQDVGNHAWDHPVLDMCTEEEQRRQVALADDWLRQRLPGWLPTFAYPNGNWAPGADDELRKRKYELAVLHDHRIAPDVSRPLALSRLHVDAVDGVPRYGTVVSGLQPFVKDVVRKARAVLPTGS